MTQIYQEGTINVASLIVPDLLVILRAPRNLLINGVPTHRVGVVGTANWGQPNTATIVGTYGDYVRAFGPLQPRQYDMGTQVATAIMQGAQDFRCIRVTDGTDTGASGVLQAGCLTLYALCTGSLGNAIQANLVPGSRGGTWSINIGLPGQLPERYDGITGTGAAFWTNLAAAVNSGTGQLQPGSKLVIASPGAGIDAPAASGIITLSGGTDGAGITTDALIGLDGITRTGMYAMRGTGCSIGVLADLDDVFTATTQAQFGEGEGVFMIGTGPSGETIANAVLLRATAGVDSYAIKIMLGDWVYWNDPQNRVLRVVSPQGFVAGRYANLSPEQSALNKQMYSVVGTQKSGTPGVGQGAAYSTAELEALVQGGIDVICNPVPGGSYFGLRVGHNSSSDPRRQGDNYTRLSNFVATTVKAGMGTYVGKVTNISLFAQVRSTLLSFLGSLLSQGILGTTDGSLPYGVQCDINNNPHDRTALGYVEADVQVQYQAINERFVVGLEGGQTVTINRLPTAA